jgi:hypothetical protein
MIGKISSIILSLIFSGIGVYILTNFMSTVDTSNYSSAMRLLIQIIPVVFAIMIILGIVKSFGVDSPEERIDWTTYGERLKLAYTAKFGGDNPGFDSEVDYHVKIMVNTDRGYTRQLAKDWMHRMSKFVEVEWLKLENSNEEA